jgi:cardiolipin synthase
VKGNVHGKVLLVDDEFASIGSYDLNNLSTYSNIELNLNIVDTNFAQTVKSEFNNVIEKDCQPIDIHRHVKRFSTFRKIVCWFAYRITKSLFVLAWLVASRSQKINAN